MSLDSKLPRLGASRVVGAAALTILLTAAGACDSLLTPDRPDAARVLIEGTAPDVIHVVTSHNFVMGFTPDGTSSELQFITSDTAAVMLPFDQSYDLRANPWFAVRIMSPVGDTAEVNMRVFLDGSERFNQSTVLVDQYMQYFVTHN